MTSKANDWRELDRLIDGACDSTLSADESALLGQWLAKDAQARDRYVSSMNAHAQLAWLAKPRKPFSIGELVCRDQTSCPQEENDNELPAPVVIESPQPVVPPLLHQTIACFSGGMPLACLLAMVMTGCGLLIAGLVHVSGPERVAKNVMAPVVEPRPEYVGQVTGVVDCRWREGSRVYLGQKVDLASGLMEITYDTGAKVILQGPVTYEVESANGGYMQVGKLTGLVEKKMAKGFFVRTPGALVTDLGTEFGVEVGNNGKTQTVVFVGAVRMTAGGRSDPNEGRILRAGQTASLTKESCAIVVADQPATTPSGFIRRLECSTSKTISPDDPRVLIATADLRPATWRYRTFPPGDDWMLSGYDDSSWSEGTAGFGKGYPPPTVMGTPWQSADIWLRKSIVVPSPIEFHTAALKIHHDEDVEVYVNGRLVFREPRYRYSYATFDVTEPLKAALKPGANVIAVHVHQTTRGQYIDLGLTLNPREAIPPPAPWPGPLPDMGHEPAHTSKPGKETSQKATKTL